MGNSNTEKKMLKSNLYLILNRYKKPFSNKEIERMRESYDYIL